MAGPVWRLEATLLAPCAVCFRETLGVYVEGEVKDNDLERWHAVCQDCYRRATGLVVSGEAGCHVSAPAYGRRP